MKNKARWLRRLQISLLTLALLAIGVWLLLDQMLKPSLWVLGEAAVRAKTAEALNAAISEMLSEGIVYDDLVNVRTGSNGQVTMIQANVARMNQLASNVSIAAQNNIANIGEIGVSVRLGTALGMPLFTGKGPLISMSVRPAGAITSSFSTEFHSAGINQTRHMVYIKLTAKVSIITPSETRGVEVISLLPVAESVIVGEVPQSYIDANGVDEAYNFVP